MLLYMSCAKQINVGCLYIYLGPILPLCIFGHHVYIYLQKLVDIIKNIYIYIPFCAIKFLKGLWNVNSRLTSVFVCVLNILSNQCNNYMRIK